MSEPSAAHPPSGRSGRTAWARFSIRWKFAITFLLVSLIPLGSFATWDVLQSRRELVALVEGRLLSHAQRTVEAIEAYLQERRLDAERQARGPVLVPAVGARARLTETHRRLIEATLQSHRRTYGYLRIALLLPDGEASLVVGDPIPEDGTESRRTFRAALSGRTAVSDPFFAGSDGPYVLEVAAPVAGPSGAIRGALLFALPFDGIARIVREDNDRAGLGTVGTILNGQMIRIAHSSDSALVGRPLTQLPGALIEALVRDARFGQQTAHLLGNPSGHDEIAARLAALRPGGAGWLFFDLVPPAAGETSRAVAAPFRTTPWVYSIAAPYSAFLGPVQAEVRRALTVTALVAGSTVLLAWVFGGVMARRLRNLAKTTERLAAGDFTARADPGPPDEIGRLAQTFDAMARALEHHEAAGRDRVARLEALTEVGRSVTSSLDLEEVLSLVVGKGVQAMGMHAAAIFATGAEAGPLRIAKAQGLSREFTAAHFVPPGTGLPGLALREGRPAWTEDAQAEGQSSIPEAVRARLATEGIRAMLVAPIRTPSGPYGVLTFFRHDVHPFDPDQVRFATLLADQAGIAIENARLFQQEQKRLRQLEAVRTVTAEITRELDLTSLLGLITRRAVDLIDAPSGTLYLWDEAAGLLIPRAWKGIGDWISAVRLRLGEGTAGFVAQRREGVLVDDYQNWPFASPLFKERTRATVMLAEPLLYRDRLLGVLVLNNLGTERRFSAQDRDLLALFAAQAAIAIQNARLVEQRSEQMVALSDALRRLVIAQPLETFFRDLVEMARQAVGARYAALGVLGADGKIDRFVPTGLPPEAADRIGPLPVGRGLLGHMLRAKAPLRLEDLARHPQSSGFPPNHPAMRTFLGTRIAFQEEVIGALYLTEKEGGAPFTAEDERLVEAFAANAAVAIANARAYQEVQDARRVLEVKTKELEAFTYTVSHDLKAPLRGIDGFSRALQEDYGDRLDAEGKRYLQMVRSAARRMDDLIEDLLKYSRLERHAMRRSRVDLSALCDRILEDRQRQFAMKQLTVQVKLAVSHVEAEPDGLREAVANLIDNAIKFSRPGGAITVSSRLDDGFALQGAGPGGEEGNAGGRPAATRIAAHVVVAVQDDGIGFDMRYHDRIFDIFQRLHRVEEYEGTGVGLAIVKKVAERHAGRAWAASEPGKGSTFFLAIPNHEGVGDDPR